MMYEVNNVNPSAFTSEFMIIRDCRNTEDGGYWYYGADDNVTTCCQIAKEIRNGIVVRSCDVKALTLNKFA